MLGRLFTVLEGRIGKGELDLSKLGKIDLSPDEFGHEAVSLGMNDVVTDDHPVGRLVLRALL